MCDYAGLPTLMPVMDKIFGYLSVKERLRCKGVCRSWRAEIELREQKSDTLVLHFGPYPWNMRWSETNNRRLMKFENSFQVKHPTSLRHPLTRALLKKIKNLAIVAYDTPHTSEASSIEPYLGYFKHCEVIEIRSLRLYGTLTFDLLKLKVLVIKDHRIDKLVLSCSSLEVLFCDSKVKEIDFQNAQKLKRLTCFRWSAFSLNGILESLEYLNLFTDRYECVSGRLLGLMPKLKRFVLYSNNLQDDLESIRKQQKLFGLKNLEVLFFGFRDPVQIGLDHDWTGFVKIDHVGQLFENYSKLVESSPWAVQIDYSQLFSTFKILPSDFFERFREIDTIEIREVTNYIHLYEFLKCCPSTYQLRVHYSKVNADRILDLVHLLQFSLKGLVIVEERPSDGLKIDFSFLRILDLLNLTFESTRIPSEFLRKVAAKRGPRFQGINFNQVLRNHKMTFGFLPQLLFCMMLAAIQRFPNSLPWMSSSPSCKTTVT